MDISVPKLESAFRKLVGLVAVPAASVATGILIIFLYPFRLSDANVAIDVMYMRYACGDCYVQYRVLSADEKAGGMQARTFDNESATPMRFIGWDVVVLYKGSDKPLLEEVDPSTASRNDCASAVVRLSGQFKRKLIYMFLYSGERYDGIYFDADSASIVPNGIHGCRPSRRASIR